MTIERIEIDEAQEIIQSLDLESGRRAFLKALGLGAVGAAVLGAAGSEAAAAAQITDADILNFALNLEYLEATFYHYAYYGTDLPPEDLGANPGPVTGGQKASISDPSVQALAKELAIEETKHVELLRAIFPSPVDRPALDIGDAFTKLFAAAGLKKKGGAPFHAYDDDTSFLVASYIFEDVGVTAYRGALTLLQDSTYQDLAAGIMAVEAYHAGIVRTALFPADEPREYLGSATTKISQLRSLLSTRRKQADDLGVGTFDDPTLVPVDAPEATMFVDVPGGDAIAYVRSTDQVLNIVYGGYGQKPGLFFPNGFNGTIK